MNKKTLVLGASLKPERYSNFAINNLVDKKHEVLAIGNKAGTVRNIPVSTELINAHNIDTVTLYLNPENQKPYYDYILSLHPRRIIFNPGTENEELEQLAQKAGIEVVEACTLVMLRTGVF